MTATAITGHSAAATPPLPQRQAMLAVGFSCLGWAFDLFDLFILLYVAPVLARLFFPSDVPMLSLAAVYASFTATLLMRPVGGMLFGPLADTHGRKRAMVIASVGVGTSTALMGLLPTLQQAGVIAPLLFLALRLIQGVFMGGMVASTHTLGTESIAPRWRGLASGIISGGGSGIGKLMASLVFLLASTLFPGPAFDEWGWRVMFFSGLLSSVLGLLVFTQLQESPLWASLQQHKAATPVKREKPPARRLLEPGNRRAAAIGIALTFAGGALSYLTSGYLPSFLRLVNQLPAQETGLILSACAFAVMASSVLAGWITDLIGRRKAMVIYGLISLVGIPLLYRALGGATSTADIAWLAVALSALGTLAYAPLLIVLNELFPTAIRSTGTAVSWNIGFSLGGATPVLVSLLSAQASGLALTLVGVTATIALLYLLALAFTPETRGAMR